ncbi:C40 family peptidase [Streptomyces ficellus]|uniref:C40 family peptidase n=1 Tax=Streptomyces ficellus TaxID=1977088 RepID=A0ABT7Z7T5_9ACTN|nr:C40 family peptidase [Streptomyces ficellus]MDN3295564.1 C40 family peptidase [Streptomyces ficellus]
MSHTAHIPSHRKPRRNASKLALRAGVAGGVLSTIAVAGAAGPAHAEPVTETIEMPTLNADLSANLSSAVAASAEATQQIALDQELQTQENAAAAKAAKEAKTAKAEAERKAEAEAKRKAEAQAKAEAAERASRSAERTTLSASAGSDDGGSSFDISGSSQATGSAAAIVDFARAQVGDAYVMGSTGPNSWDCSGLVQAAYRQAGIELPRVSGDQSSRGTSVSLDDLQPGDILYWGSRSDSYHVAIYVGGGNYVGAQNPSTGVVERSLDYDMPSGAVRVL